MCWFLIQNITRTRAKYRENRWVMYKNKIRSELGNLKEIDTAKVLNNGWIRKSPLILDSVFFQDHVFSLFPQ